MIKSAIKKQQMKPLLICFLLYAATPLYSQQTGATMARVDGGQYVPIFSQYEATVNVVPFLMDIYPVTNKDFQRFVTRYPEWSRSSIKRLFADDNYLTHWSSDFTFSTEIANSPVVNISWFAARKYCECQGKRLAETSEWEVAARASKTLASGRTDPEFNQWILNWVTRPVKHPLPEIGSTFRNYFGISDLHGLVWEWTNDFSSALTTGESRGTNSQGNDLFCGGGSFGSQDTGNYAAFMRYALRSSLKASYCLSTLGFRCVR